MNDKIVVHPSNDLTNNDYSNIENRDIHQEQTNQNNSFYTINDNKFQSRSYLEYSNKANDWKTTNSHEGELVMVYDNYN